MQDDENSLVGLNDVNSNILPKETFSEKMKKIIILISSLFLFLVILVIIILVNAKPKNKNDNKSKLIGKIECIYYIDSTKEFTNISYMMEFFSLSAYWDLKSAHILKFIK